MLHVVWGPEPAPSWCDLGCRVCWQTITDGQMAVAVSEQRSGIGEQSHETCWDEHLAGHEGYGCTFCRWECKGIYADVERPDWTKD